ncbi:MAG: hypothetical protein SGJ21_07445 [Alphaproteobacteria bacterium]|nr:hypothetical protein [Alphaproteobacteria bacterium]
MPRKRIDPDTVQFTITMRAAAADHIEKLVETGVYGKSRAEAAMMIIMRHLQELREKDQLPK